MDEVLNYSMNEMAGADFDCSCGRHHTLDIRHIIMGQGVLKELPKVLEPFSGKRFTCSVIITHLRQRETGCSRFWKPRIIL